VVEVLAPPSGIGANGLDVTEGIGADPHVFPSRRDGELADPLEDFRVLDPVSLLVQVLEAASAAAAGDPGPGTIDSA
jgi:hypothetical protein